MLDSLLLDTEALLAAIELELGTARARVQE
jgi:hypothetical protein